MKIVLTKGVKEKIVLFSSLIKADQGFIIGRLLGHNIFISDLICVAFDKNTIGFIYDKVFTTYQSTLLGVFFLNQEIIFDLWLIGDILLSIKGKDLNFFTCDFKRDSFRKIFLEGKKIGEISEVKNGW